MSRQGSPVPHPRRPSGNRLWGVEEVSEYLGVPVATLHYWRYRREGPPAMKVGRHLRYDPTRLVQWLEDQSDQHERTER